MTFQLSKRGKINTGMHTSSQEAIRTAFGKTSATAPSGPIQLQRLL
jgi:hypothetical protein